MEVIFSFTLQPLYSREGPKCPWGSRLGGEGGILDTVGKNKSAPLKQTGPPIIRLCKPWSCRCADRDIPVLSRCSSRYRQGTVSLNKWPL